MLPKTIRQYANIKILILMPIRRSSIKRYARKCKEESFLRIKTLSGKPHEGFSRDEDKIEFCKRLKREREGIKEENNRVL